VGFIHTFADRSDLYIYPVGCYCHTDIYQDLSGRPDAEKRTGRVSGIFVQSEISAYPLYLVEPLLRMKKTGLNKQLKDTEKNGSNNGKLY
jgi:hypothetical protein